jgi:hypothetical protein
MLLAGCLVIGCASGERSTIRGSSELTEYISTTALPRDLSSATALDVDRFGAIYVLSANKLLKLDSTGDSVRAVSGRGADHYQFDDAVDLDTRLPNTVLIADRLNHRIEIYSRDLAYISTIYTRDNSDPIRRFGYPRSVAADKAGNVFVLDGEGQRVLKFHADRTYERTFGGYGEASRPEAMLSEPIALAIDAEDRVTVLDRAGRSLVIFDNFGTPITRRDLEAQCSRLASIHDTLFALSAQHGSGGSLLIFALPSLTPLGLCAADTMQTDGDVRDVALRESEALWLHGRRIERLTFRPRYPQTPTQ